MTDFLWFLALPIVAVCLAFAGYVFFDALIGAIRNVLPD